MKDKIIEYFNKRKINLGYWLSKDINIDNRKALCYVDYAINYLLEVTGIENLLKDIALIEDNNVNGKRAYHNILAEFHGIYFVQNILSLRISEVESNRNRILSPYRKSNDKSCDIKAIDDNRDYYFETKDESSEIMTQENKGGVIQFTPKFEDEVYKWMLDKCSEADQKGANYLLCRVPVWHDPLDDDFFYKWLSMEFHIIKRLSDNEVIITLPVQCSESFEGIYIIKSYGFMKLLIQR